MTESTQNRPKDLRIQERIVNDLYELWDNGQLTLNPSYQRGHVWNDERRYALIDSVLAKYPIGVVILGVKTSRDPDGEIVESFDAVDGQQRLETLFEYIRGNQSWTHPTVDIELYPFTRFQDLSEVRKRAVRNYEVPIAYLRNYDQDDIETIFLRVQFGMALTIGEKLKNIKSELRQPVTEITRNAIFNTEWGRRYILRDLHWTLSTGFLMSAIRSSPFQRLEYKHLHDFLRSGSAARAGQSTEMVKRLLNRARDILTEASSDRVVRRGLSQGPRVLKMLFAALMSLDGKFPIHGREPDIARSLTSYLTAVADDSSTEGIEWTRTLRTVRMDTDDVKRCVATMCNYIVNVAELEPLDQTRFFTREQRAKILARAGGHCENVLETGVRCNASLSPVNYHADHRLPWIKNGPTIIENGQALCSGCNSSKGASMAYLKEG